MKRIRLIIIAALILTAIAILLIGDLNLASCIVMLALLFGVTASDLRLHEDALAYSSSIIGVLFGLALMFAQLYIPAIAGFIVATIFVSRLVNVARWYRKEFGKEAKNKL